MTNKILTYEVKLEGRKIHYRKEKWEKWLIEAAIGRGLHELGYGDMTEVISVREILLDVSERTENGNT